MRYELYVLHAEFDGTGFPLAYLFLEGNGQTGNGVRTYIITEFCKQMRDQENIYPQFLLSDKDFAQISAAQMTWPTTKVQLCQWHLLRAVKTKLKNSKLPKQMSYSNIAANNQFSFIDPNFMPITEQQVFCPKEYHDHIINLVKKHLHRHPLIPAESGQYLTKEEIYRNAVEEMYNFCKESNLPWLWAYMWKEWYAKEHWILWARSASNSISILKTTMFVEGHWKVIKRDFLYKFFRPRLDLVTYILVTRVVPHQKRKLQQILNGRERADWRKTFKAEWKSLIQKPVNNHYTMDLEHWVCACPYFLTSRFMICKHLIHAKGSMDPQFFLTVRRNRTCPFVSEHCDMDYLEADNMSNIGQPAVSSEDNNDHYGMETFDHLINITEQALVHLKEERKRGNTKWVKSVEKNFRAIERMVEEIGSYERQKSMPLTNKNRTHNTYCLE
jgi:hypothetical protein